MNSENKFENLSAENETSRFAQMTSEEHTEFQAWIDATRNQETDKRETRIVQSKLP